MKPGPLRHLTEGLADLERRSLLRDRPSAHRLVAGQHSSLLERLSRIPIDRPPEPIRRRSDGNEDHPVGAGASRLVSGEHQAHRALESALRTGYKPKNH